MDSDKKSQHGAQDSDNAMTLFKQKLAANNITVTSAEEFARKQVILDEKERKTKALFKETGFNSTTIGVRGSSIPEQKPQFGHGYNAPPSYMTETKAYLTPADLYVMTNTPFPPAPPSYSSKPEFAVNAGTGKEVYTKAHEKGRQFQDPEKHAMLMKLLDTTLIAQGQEGIIDLVKDDELKE